MEKSKVNSMSSELKNAVKRPEITITKKMISNEQLPKKNKAYSLNCSVLFLDLRNSTYITQQVSKENMVMVYKALTRIVTRSAEEYDGELRQICGDSYMLLFIDSKENEDIIKSSQKAVDCAITINTYVKNSLSDFMRANSINGKASVGLGIRTGEILMTKVGVKGKDKFQTPVFPGDITNMACKLCNEAESEELIIDQITYQNIDKNTKKNFKNREIKYDNPKAFSTMHIWEIE